MISPLTEKIKEHLSVRVQNSELSNDDIVSIIDHLGAYLNLMTVSDYANSCDISYNGALKRIESGKVKEYNLFNVKFVIDND